MKLCYVAVVLPSVKTMNCGPYPVVAHYIRMIDAILIGRFQKWHICSSINGSLGSSRMRGSGPAPVFRDHQWVVGAAPVYGLQRRFQQEVGCKLAPP